MSDISAISGLPPTWEESQAAAAGGTPDEFGQETFLGLLTTQLQNQDPLDPMKNEQFIAQLAQFSSLEQLIGIQQSMDAVYAGIAAMNNATMANLLGSEVVAVGNEFSMDGESGADLHYLSDSGFDSATVTIRDESGSVVFSGPIGGAESGEGSWHWDGTDLSGQPVPAGEYTFEISATDADGSVEVEELIVGTVNEMDYSTGVPQPSVDGVAIDLADILRLTTGNS